MVDIRKETALIIRKDGKYLVGYVSYSHELKWSSSAWDAWRTRIREDAVSVRKKTGGEILLFNPVAGQMRRAEI